MDMYSGVGSSDLLFGHPQLHHWQEKDSNKVALLLYYCPCFILGCNIT